MSEMAKAIHLINQREGLTRKGLAMVERATNTWRSCCWVLSDHDQDQLLGGWLYLHETKSRGASYGGQIIGFEAAAREGAAIGEGVAILFRAHLNARGRKWRGAGHSLAWSSGLVEADYDHERLDL